MSVKELSALSGLHPNTIVGIEDEGRGVYSYSILKAIADAFGVKVHEMAGEPVYDVRPTVLMSSASMPNDGFYVREAISIDHFIRLVRGAWLIGNLTSYVGYTLTSDYIEHLTGAKVGKVRTKTTLVGDKTCRVVICKLRFRQHDKLEMRVPHNDDFEYINALYNKYHYPKLTGDY